MQVSPGSLANTLLLAFTREKLRQPNKLRMSILGNVTVLGVAGAPIEIAPPTDLILRANWNNSSSV